MPCQPLRSWGWLWTQPIGAKNPQVVSRALTTHPSDFQESDRIESTQMSWPRVWSEMQGGTEPIFSNRFIRISKPWLEKKMVRTASPKVYVTLVSHCGLEDRTGIVWRAMFIASLICARSSTQTQGSLCASVCRGHLHANRRCLASSANGSSSLYPSGRRANAIQALTLQLRKWVSFFSPYSLLALSHVQLFATLSAACQAPLSMWFPRQEHWSGLSFPSSGDLPDPRIEPRSPVSPALYVDSLPTEPSTQVRQHSY